MTALFRMAIALLFQGTAYFIRCVLFVILGLVRPIDYLADGFSRVAVWLAVDENSFRTAFPVKETSNDRQSDSE